MSIHPTSFTAPVLVLTERDRVKDAPRPIAKSIETHRAWRRTKIASRTIPSCR